MSESKALLIGDPHFKSKNSFETSIMHSKILETIDSRGPYDFIVCMGDVLHNKNTITLSVYYQALKFLNDLASKAHLYLIVGNHDRQSEKDFLSDVSCFYPLKGRSDISIIDSPLLENIGDQKFTFVPFVPPGRFEEALSYTKTRDHETVDWKSSTAIFAHQEFLGSTPSGEGDVWDPNLPPVYTGHVHSYQFLFEKSVIYVSTPLQHSFIETGRKGIVELSSGNKLSHEFIDLDVPRFYKVNCHIRDIFEKSPTDIFSHFHADPEKDSLQIFAYGETSFRSTNWFQDLSKNPRIQLYLKSNENPDSDESSSIDAPSIDFWTRLYSNIDSYSHSNSLRNILNGIMEK